MPLKAPIPHVAAIALLSLLCPVPLAIAQPADPQIAPKSPSPAPSIDLGMSDALVTDTLRAHYRESPWAEQLVLELTPTNAPSRRTSVRIACDPASDAANALPSRPAVRLELDSLTIVATPSRLTATNSAAPELAYDIALDATRPLIDQLRELLPALPFPQLHLALEPEGVDAWGRAMHAIAPNVENTAPKITSTDPTTGVIEFSSSQPGSEENPPSSELPPASFTVKYLPERGAFIELTARDTFGTAPGTLRITCKPLDPPAPDAFTLNIANRQRVDSLARLRPPEPEIKPGMRLPALGLVDDALALWSPQAAFDAQRTPLNTPVRLALVFYNATDQSDEASPTQADDAFDALLLARGLSDKYRRDSVNSDRTPQPEDPEPLPRVGVVPVAVFDIAAFDPEAVREEAIAWSELGTPGAFTSAGPTLLKRFNPSGGVAVVVIDDNQIVRGVVPWDGRTSAQRRNDLDAALRGTPLRRSAPDHPADAANPPSP